MKEPIIDGNLTIKTEPPLKSGAVGVDISKEKVKEDILE